MICATHYLLPIADILTAELKKDKKYDETSWLSNKMCLTLYTKGQEDFKLVNWQQPYCRELVWKLCSWRYMMVSFLVLLLFQFKISYINFVLYARHSENLYPFSCPDPWWKHDICVIRWGYSWTCSDRPNHPVVDKATDDADQQRRGGGEIDIASAIFWCHGTITPSGSWVKSQ